MRLNRNISKPNKRSNGQTKLVFAISFAAMMSLAVSLFLLPTIQSTRASVQETSVSINGLVCPLPLGTPSNVGVLAQEVVQTHEFLSATGGLPYKLVSFDYMTDRMMNSSSPSGSVTTLLPNATELGFASYGPGTSCTESGSSWAQWIDVQVPILDGGYNLTGESVHLVGGAK